MKTEQELRDALIFSKEQTRDIFMEIFEDDWCTTSTIDRQYADILNKHIQEKLDKFLTELQK